MARLLLYTSATLHHWLIITTKLPKTIKYNLRQCNMTEDNGRKQKNGR